MKNSHFRRLKKLGSGNYGDVLLMEHHLDKNVLPLFFFPFKKQLILYFRNTQLNELHSIIRISMKLEMKSISKNKSTIRILLDSMNVIKSLISYVSSWSLQIKAIWKNKCKYRRKRGTFFQKLKLHWKLYTIKRVFYRFGIGLHRFV